MSAADAYIPIRADAAVADGRRVALHALVTPEMWEDRPILEGYCTRRLQRTAELHGAGELETDTLTIARLEVLPALEHLTRPT